MAEGVDGLLREKTRPPGTPRTPDEKVVEVIRLTRDPPPHEATHWTIRAIGKAVGLAASTVREFWKAHGLSPHLWRQFKLSNDRAFAEKLNDVVGLYVSPPAHAVLLSVDEKSQIQRSCNFTSGNSFGAVGLRTTGGLSNLSSGDSLLA